MIEGEPDYVKESLFRKVGAFSRHGAFHQKVGITANPAIRWRTHAAAGWRSMEVVYRSEFYEDVCYLERKLVRRFEFGLVRSPGYHHNAVFGGGGRRPGLAFDHFVYVLSAGRNARLRL